MLELTALFKNLVRKISHEWNKRMEDGMSISQFRTLYILNSRGPQKTAELAETLGVTSGAITGLADKLIAKGMLERERSEEDRRVVYLRMTDKGKETLDRLLDTQREAIALFFKPLAEEDIEHLRRIFMLMLNGADQTDD
ncbi:MarR family winged helix-turn-helix transcriptional regulator [Paenibacillus flagellatus]|nr:MarR family transcriptional regulator [Paenibacillus flagellatus]